MVRTIQIDDFCETGTGGTPSRAKLERYYEGGTIPWVKSGELRESVIVDTEEHLTEYALRESNAKIVPAGSLLLAMYGATVGRVGVLGVPATTNQAVCHIIPDPGMADRQYLFWALRASLPDLLSQRVGGAQPNISQSIIRRLGIRLPPLPEQRRIADILDRAEALRAKRRETLTQLDDLSHSIFLDMFGDQSCEVASKWPKVKVSDYVHHFEGGKSLDSTEGSSDSSDYRILKVSAVTSMFFKPGENKAAPRNYVPPKGHIVKNGDLLFSRANTSDLVGAVAYVKGAPKNLLLPDKLWRFVWREPTLVDPVFVWILFQSKTVRREISRRATGTSDSMKNISQEKLLQIMTPLPPLALQQEFSRRIQAIEQLKAKHRQSLAEIDALFRSLQHRAFRGEL